MFTRPESQELSQYISRGILNDPNARPYCAIAVDAFMSSVAHRYAVFQAKMEAKRRDKERRTKGKDKAMEAPSETKVQEEDTEEPDCYTDTPLGIVPRVRSAPLPHDVELALIRIDATDDEWEGTELAWYRFLDDRRTTVTVTQDLDALEFEVDIVKEIELGFYRGLALLRLS